MAVIADWCAKLRHVPCKRKSDYNAATAGCLLDKYQKQTAISWDQATTDTTQIERWKAEGYEAFALLCGDNDIDPSLDVVTLDFDSKAALDKLYEIEREVGMQSPATARINTSVAEDGFIRHQRPFLVQKGLLKTCTSLGGVDGFDIRGQGGYIMAPRSIVDNHQYELVNNNPLAVMPERLAGALAALQQGSAKTPNSGAEKIDKGRRNDALTRKAGVLRSMSLGREEIEVSLLKINREQCNPPLPDSEVRRIAASVARYAPTEAKEKTKPKRKLFLITSKSMADIANEVKLWLFLNLILADELNLLVGDPDVGKGFFTALLVACVTTGSALPLGGKTSAANKSQKRKVLYYCPEDSYNSTVKPRLIVAGADLSMVVPIHGVGTSPDDKDFFPLRLDSAEHLEAVRDAIAQVGEVALAVFDPLCEMAGEIDIYRPDVRFITSGLTKLAREAEVCVCLVHHTNKRGADSGIKAAAGNFQIMASVQNCWLFAVDPEADGRFLMMQARNKSGQRRSFKYRIANKEWPDGFRPEEDDDEHDGCGLFEFVGKSKTTATEYLQRAQDRDASANSRAHRWLADLLARGAVKNDHAWAEADKRNLSRDVVNKACLQMGIIRDKGLWSLPPEQKDVKEEPQDAAVVFP